MKRTVTRGVGPLGLGLAMFATACNSENPSNIENNVATGGMTSTDGAAITGGSPSGQGGAPLNSTESRANSGGATSVGGTNSVSTTGTGGTTAGSSNGGATATGGQPTSTGGTSNTTGGTSAGGSSTTVGGSTQATGGSTSEAAGGASTGGQSSATGGSGVGGQTTTPASATAKFPFPQNRRDTSCIYPTNADYGDVQSVYDAWKTHLVTSDGVGSGCTSCRRVKRVAEPGLQKDSTVSEGIAYGMIIAVYMDDPSLFDDLWRYEQAHTWTASSGFPPSSAATNLMNWYIAADGAVATSTNGGQSGTGAATDADEDMAWALIMADKQWGGSGSLSDTYANYAKKLLGDIWKYEIENNRTPKNGGGWGGENCLNISYFAPSYYRVFATYSGETRWSSGVVPNVYSIIAASLNAANGNQDNGLVPAFSTSTGAADQCGTGGTSNQNLLSALLEPDFLTIS